MQVANGKGVSGSVIIYMICCYLESRGERERERSERSDPRLPPTKQRQMIQGKGRVQLSQQALELITVTHLIFGNVLEDAIKC